MSHLSLSLFGTLEATLAKVPLIFAYDKVRALLVYLAVEADRPHRRGSLANLLWPDRPETQARQSLSQALLRLRQALGQTNPPFLLITPQTLQFNRSSDYHLDVTTFTALIAACQAHHHTGPAACAACLGRLEQAVALYRGSFLPGFALAGSPAFEEWAVLERERLQRLALEALRHLAEAYEAQGRIDLALPYAWRQVALDPWQEEACRQVMRLLARQGQREAALTQYATCCRLLRADLGIEPAEETTYLYEQIRTNALSQGTGLELPLASLPAYLCVARETELSRLDSFLEAALTGQGQVVFVTGEAGQGKTTLLQEFARRARAAHPALMVTGGNGLTLIGRGVPFLPFRQILGRLTGDGEAGLAGGVLSRVWPRQEEDGLSLAIRALLDEGPDLIDTFLPGAALLHRAAAGGRQVAGWLPQLQQLVERHAGQAAPSRLARPDLIEQYIRVLAALARQRPLLLLLDDLQWADASSLNLLFQFSRRLATSRVLIAGAYRPAEVMAGEGAPGRTGRARWHHPLEQVVSECKRLGGDIEIDLSQAEERRFVDRLLDSEPNRLDERFRQTLYEQTRSHPLFTVELLRTLQARGDLVRDSAGCWVAGANLNWDPLPERVEAVIAASIAQLPKTLQQALKIASVQGDTFSVEVVAQVLRADEQETVQQFSDTLARLHRLVSSPEIRLINGRPLSYYAFRHSLYQKYLYRQLDPAERTYLHRAVGQALVEQYGQRVGDIAVLLAHHFSQAGEAATAVEYLGQAGEAAANLSAYQEAETHFRHGLRLLAELPGTAERVHQELRLQVGLATTLLATKGYGGPEVGRCYDRAWLLCSQVGETWLQFRVLWLLAFFHTVLAEHDTASNLLEQIRSLAGQSTDSHQELLAHWGLAMNHYHRGEFSPARDHASQVMERYDPKHFASLPATYGEDPGVACLFWAATALWMLGYPDQARQHSRQALDQARHLDHPFSLARAQLMAALVHNLCGEASQALAMAEACLDLSARYGFPFWSTTGLMCQGEALARLGQVEVGLDRLRQGLANSQVTGNAVGQTYYLAMLAETYGLAGQPAAGLASLAEAATILARTGERFWEAEIYRLQGELAWQVEAQGGNTTGLGTLPAPETCFRQAIQVARRQEARSLELRAALSLARLEERQDWPAAARSLLAEIYGCFNEGFDTADLREAGRLLAGQPQQKALVI